jgi:hypothetical protein
VISSNVERAMLNEVLLLKNVVEICANCGKIRRKPKEAFKCTECGSDVCIVGVIIIAHYKL